MRPPEGKILRRPDVLDRFGRPRAVRVVFTNGVFDILHRGHAAYLQLARKHGDALVVGVNSDASARRLGKGAGRPVNNQDDRAYVLAALECVDAVCVFDEDTPRTLLAELLPDVLVKGGDYRPENVAGREEVEGAGGRVVIIPFVDGYSTTSLVRKILEENR